MKISPKNLREESKKKYLDVIGNMIQSLNSKVETEDFINKVLTETEKIMIGRRIMIARMLLQGKENKQIVDELNVGLDTVNRVCQWLRGELKDHSLAVLRIELRKSKKKPKKFWGEYFSFTRTRKRYSGHFLLLNILLD